MPYSYRIDTDRSVVLFRATGVFSSSELLGCLKEVVADPKFRRNFDHLVDLREVSEFQAGASEMRDRTDADRQMQQQIGECRIALVSSRALVYGMTRMYEIMMDDAGPVVRTFSSIRDATKWLGIRETSTARENEV
jgi:hypothetical protein